MLLFVLCLILVLVFVLFDDSVALGLDCFLVILFCLIWMLFGWILLVGLVWLRFDVCVFVDRLVWFGC